ncbi:MAG: hypothetical protein JWO32_329 [Bacteroidetes bacterium]|nr:hypothetical protein [Bacteroidota bacterium]
MNKAILIIALLLGIGISNEVYSQAGGRKREHRNQRRGGSIFKRSRSAGHADNFAKGAGRKGIMARLFKKNNPSWVYHSTNPGKTQNREQRFLFSRFRTHGKKYKDGIQAKLNSDRSRKRQRGNSTFKRKKY